MNRPQRAEIRERCFIIIPFSCDSSPKVVFIRHSGFPDCNPPRVCLENLSETPPRGRKRVEDVTDRRSTLFTQVYSNAEPSFNKKLPVGHRMGHRVGHRVGHALPHVLSTP